MASSNDVRDIMGLERGGGGGGAASGSGYDGGGGGGLTKEMILSGYGAPPVKKSGKKSEPGLKRPEGMARELYNLLYNDSKDAPPIIPTDTAMGIDHGYKQMKAKLGMRKVRPWKWMAFSNPARRDGLVLHHWRRAADEGKEYPFARFNKKLDMPSFSDLEYSGHLQADGWTRPETDHLLDLCQRFDLRFTVVHDRWDRAAFKKERSVEDLKERYYGLCEKLELLHADPSKQAKPFVYDADHERRRKEQLKRLYNRTPEQVEEEELLKIELRKIDNRKKLREQKTQDLQKLIAQADSSSSGSRDGGGGSSKHEKKSGGSHSKRKVGSSSGGGSSGGRVAGGASARDVGQLDLSLVGIKFPDFSKGGGSSVWMRSQRMKLPQSLGQKKTVALDKMLGEVPVEKPPMPTESIVADYNDMRSEMVLLYELKNALSACDVELQSLKAQYEALCPGKSLEIPDRLKPPAPSVVGSVKGEKATKNLADVIDVVGNGPTPPVRKRKAALEQGNVLKKIKNKNF